LIENVYLLCPFIYLLFFPSSNTETDTLAQLYFTPRNELHTVCISKYMINTHIHISICTPKHKQEFAAGSDFILI